MGKINRFSSKEIKQKLSKLSNITDEEEYNELKKEVLSFCEKYEKNERKYRQNPTLKSEYLSTLREINQLISQFEKEHNIKSGNLKVKKRDNSRSNIWIINDLHVIFLLAFISFICVAYYFKYEIPLGITSDFLNLIFSFSFMLFAGYGAKHLLKYESGGELEAKYFESIKDKIPTIFGSSEKDFLYLKLRTNAVLVQFIFWWKLLWGSWILFYLWHIYYRIIKWNGQNDIMNRAKNCFIDGSEKLGLLSLLDTEFTNTFLLYLFQNLSNACLIGLFLIMYINSLSMKKVLKGTSLEKDLKYNYSINKNPWVFWCLGVLIIVAVVVTSFVLAYSENSTSDLANKITILTGVFGGIALSLFVGRVIDNDFLYEKKVIWIFSALLYLYALIRTFYPIILTDILYDDLINKFEDENLKIIIAGIKEDITDYLIMIALFLKVILFLVVKWLMCTKRFIYLIWEESLLFLRKKSSFYGFKNSIK